MKNLLFSGVLFELIRTKKYMYISGDFYKLTYHTLMTAVRHVYYCCQLTETHSLLSLNVKIE